MRKLSMMTSAAALSVAMLFAAGASAQPAPAAAPAAPAAEAGPPVLAKELAPARGGRLLVSSGVFSNGRSLADKYTQFGDSTSPSLQWDRGPIGTVSYVVLAEDAGVARKDPIIHWVAYNMSVATTSIKSGQPAGADLTNGGKQGLNQRGMPAYLGPKPPAGQVHPYHFEVFAVDQMLDLDPAKADRNAVVEAMKGHVLAIGDIVANVTGK